MEWGYVGVMSVCVYMTLPFPLICLIFLFSIIGGVYVYCYRAPSGLFQANQLKDMPSIDITKSRTIENVTLDDIRYWFSLRFFSLLSSLASTLQEEILTHGKKMFDVSRFSL